MLIALITGGNSWIGKEIARTFHQAGYHVIIIGRTKESLKETSQSLKHSQFYVADMRKEKNITYITKTIIKQWRKIDVVVHSAAIYPVTPLESISLEEWKNVLDSNLTSAFLLTKACLPYMKKQKSGKIIYISSVVGNAYGVKNFSHYGASKAGLNGFMRTVALECAPYNITVNSVDPGNICNVKRWKMDPTTIDKMIASIPLGRLGTPNDVAEMALFLASDKTNWITGQNFVVDGGETIAP